MRIELNAYEHLIGKHCISSALMNYFKYFNIEMSEAMAFGLDSSLGFCYKKYDEYSKIPAYYTGGRNYSWIENICNTMGLKHRRITYSNHDEAWSAIEESILNNIPAIAELDKSKLDYWKGVVREVPFHMVLVVGYDTSKNTVWLGDTYENRIENCRLVNKLHVTNMEAFQEARNAEFQWGKIENALHTIKIPKDYIFNKCECIKNAIAYNQMLFMSECKKILYEFYNDLGCWIKMLPDNLYSKDKKRNISPLRYQLLITGKMFDEVGTGGGNFRTLYYKFLKEASKEFDNDEKLLYASKLFQCSSNDWTNLANLLCSASYKKSLNEIQLDLKKGQTILKQCIEYEIEAFEVLKNWS